MNDPILDGLYANAIGQEVMRYIRQSDGEELARQVDRHAIGLLREIKEILDDRTLDDPECFYRIDAIVQAFQGKGISTERHWEAD